MKIELARGRHEKEAGGLFSKREWRIFERERDYRWQAREYTLVAREGRKIEGIARMRTGGGAAYLSQLIVSKDSRRKKVGYRLLMKFEQLAKGRKCYILYLETSDAHREARQFYKKYGYRKIAMLKSSKSPLSIEFMAKLL